MPTLLPREMMDATSVVSASHPAAFPFATQGRLLHFVNEATSRFTCVTACSLAVWKLTTSCYHNAASSYYRGVRTTPQAGLQPARFTVVTANVASPLSTSCHCVSTVCASGRWAKLAWSGFGVFTKRAAMALRARHRRGDRFGPQWPGKALGYSCRSATTVELIGI